MEYLPTAASAAEFAQAGQIEAWVHAFLCGEGNNKAFSDGLKLRPRTFFPPALMDLSAFERCCGPEENMFYRTPEEPFHRKVGRIQARFLQGDWDMPPLIVNHAGGKYVLNDGNHRFEALTKAGIPVYWVILWETPGEP